MKSWFENATDEDLETYNFYNITSSGEVMAKYFTPIFTNGVFYKIGMYTSGGYAECLIRWHGLSEYYKYIYTTSTTEIIFTHENSSVNMNFDHFWFYCTFGAPVPNWTVIKVYEVMANSTYIPTYISNCSVLDQAGTYYLTADIIDSTATKCMDITANNVVLDCQGHTIDGIGAEETYGINVYSDSPTTTNITIKNCILTNWAFGIHLHNSNYNTLSNITVNSSSYYGNGIYLYSSDFNTLSNITSNSNYYGIYLSYSNSNTLTNITSNFNTNCGIYLFASDNNTLSNITANSNGNGIYLIYSSFNNLTNITANFNYFYYGIFTQGANSNTLSNITVNFNYEGILLNNNANSNTLSNIIANSNSLGIDIENSNSNIIKNSIVQNSSDYGIYLYYEDYAGNPPNLIYNNLLNNTNNFYFEGDIYPNYWNTTRQTGTRIYSNGTEIGGNYWTNPDGNGYSDTCTDYNHDGFCDDPYQLATNNYDYLPLSNKYSPYYISSCSELNVSGATYYLTQDIIDSSAPVCMNISANNVTLDCQGHTIDGVDEGGVYYGIIVSRETEETTNITIKNCVLTDWVSAGISLFYSNSNTLSNITANYNNDGIFLYYSNYNNLSNITANSGSDHGIEIYESNSNTLSNIIANSNSDSGILLDSSSFNNLTNITANSNSYGIYLGWSNSNALSNIIANSNSLGIDIDYSNSNTLSNITANSNSDIGIYLYYSNSNTLSNITANYNDGNGIYLDSSNSNTLSNITANSNMYGISLFYSNSNNLSNITANSNTYNGIYLYYSNSNTIKNSIIQDNLEFGIYLDSSGTNLIYNNLFNNTNNFYFDGTIYANEWNVTRQEGINIWNTSLGYIGGNYWTNPSGNGFSDTCVDANSDGFCDNNYTLATDNIDYLPIAKIVGYVSPYISITFSYSSINFGILQVNTINPAPNQANGVYNVSIDTNANYQVKAYGSDFTGPSPLPITHLYFDTNTTAENLAYSDAKSLSTTSQVIDSYDKTVTLNYHGYWLSVDKILAGDYNTTVSVVYENV